MKAILKNFLTDEKGLETVEYAIITGLIVAGTVTAISTLGDWVSGQFATLNTRLSTP